MTKIKCWFCNGYCDILGISQDQIYRYSTHHCPSCNSSYDFSSSPYEEEAEFSCGEYWIGAVLNDTDQLDKYIIYFGVPHEARRGWKSMLIPSFPIDFSNQKALSNKIATLLLLS